MTENKWLTRQQASEFLTNELGCPVAVRTIAKNACTGFNSIPFYKFGHRCLYKEVDLREWVENRLSKRKLNTTVEDDNG